jgi:hypothetical protein
MGLSEIHLRRRAYRIEDMNLLKRILTGGAMTTDTVQRSESDLTQRLAQVEQEIASGTGDVAQLLEEGEQLARQLKATQIRMAQERARAAKGARAAARAELDSRTNAVVVRVNTHVANLLFALKDFQSIVDELHAGADGADSRPFTELFSGLDHTFAADLTAAIRAAAPLVDWNFNAALPGGKECKPIAKREVMRIPSAYKTDIHGNPVGTVYQ